MAVRFEANESFVDYITIVGFQKRQVNSDNDYYVNDNGNQIRIDNSSGIISLLNNKGYTVDFATVFSSEQIDSFAKTGGIS